MLSIFCIQYPSVARCPNNMEIQRQNKQLSQHWKTALPHTCRGLVLALLLCTGSAYGIVPYVDPADLRQTEKHQSILGVVHKIMRNYHYLKFELDDETSDTILQNYLESLDPGRYWFSGADIEYFMRYQYQLDDMIKQGELAPAFDIFLTYRERLEERIAYALDLLKQDFDFTREENYPFDRKNTTWETDRGALDSLWRKRVKNDFLSLRLAGKTTPDIRDTLQKRYRRLLNSTQQLNNDDVFQLFVNAYTTAIEPHTSYFSPRHSENFDISMRLSLEGIGAVLRAENDYTQIVRIIPGGPADRSNLLGPEDRIIGVGQDTHGKIEDVIGWRLDDVVDLIRGPKGTIIRLDVLTKKSGYSSPSTVIQLVRDEIKLEDQAAYSTVLDAGNSRIGVISIPAFYIDFAGQSRGEINYRSSTRDVKKLILELEQQNIDGLIMDLRNNGGGSLSEALSLTGLFIDQGPVVQTRDSTGRVEINIDPEPGVTYYKPLAVLVNRHSASASEIFAGAIQDYQRGVIIGEPTYGKGTVQNIIDINRFISSSDGDDFGKLKTTIAQFYRISGGSTQHKGIIPDIILPAGPGVEKHGERALDNAIPWDQVQAAKYVLAGAPVEKFTLVRKIHQQRILEDELFQLYLEQMELLHENANRTEISLMESKRKANKEAFEEARKTILNKMRLLVDLPALAEDSDDEDISAEQRRREEEKLDAILKEASLILNDLIYHPSDTVRRSLQRKHPA